MQTRREYAHSLGLASLGRGRLSAEAHKAIEEARQKGMVFSDDNKPTPTPRPSKADTTAKRIVEDRPVIRKRTPALPRQRSQDHGYVFAKNPPGSASFLSTPKTAVMTCAKCRKGVGFCAGHGNNSLPQAPDYLGGGDLFFE